MVAGAYAYFVTRADARVGRPLTLVSVAGVYRRAHRHAYYGAGFTTITESGIHTVRRRLSGALLHQLGA